MSKRTQVLDLAPAHTICQIKNIVNCSGNYARKVCQEAGVQYIQEENKSIEEKILSLTHIVKKKEIARRVGCSPSYVTAVFAKHGLKSIAKPDNRKKVIEMTGKYSVEEIAEKLNLKKGTVRDYQNKAGVPSEISINSKKLVDSIRELGKTHKVIEIAKALGQSISNVRRIVSKHKISYVKVKREGSVVYKRIKPTKPKTKTIRSIVLELCPKHNVSEIAELTKANRKYIILILKKAAITPIAEPPKPIIVKPRNVAKTSKTVSSKIKVGQSDMNKGNAKLTAADKVMPTLVRDESKVRAVRLDSKTTKLLYPGQSGYDTPIEVLRSEWEKKQEEGLKMLKGA